jgi:hypothetical protein
LNFEAVVGWVPGRTIKEILERAIYMIGLHPNVPYHLVRLVALFATGASCTGNPRAPVHIHE